MTKFANLEDSGFIAFCERLRRWIEEADPKASAADYEQSTIVRQYGDNSRQYNMSGKGAQKNTGGHFFKADGDMNFLEIPPLPATDCCCFYNLECKRGGMDWESHRLVLSYLFTAEKRPESFLEDVERCLGRAGVQMNRMAVFWRGIISSTCACGCCQRG